MAIYLQWVERMTISQELSDITNPRPDGVSNEVTAQHVEVLQ
jgi:hypothetical protein